jgi:adenylate cyclase
MDHFCKKIQNWFLNLFLERTLLCLVILFCIGIGIALANMSNLSNSLVESQALLNSQAQADSIINSWQLYSKAVATRLAKVKGITIRHDYFLKEASIPPPATFAIELGNNVSHAQDGMSIRLYSDYPYPWRKADGGPRIPFEKDALNYFREQPEERKFYRIEKNNNRYVWRYAQAVIMETSCVACHNTDPNSPKKDWNVGDVRGVVEITQSLDSISKTSNQGLKQTFLMLGSLSILTISGLTLVTGRLNRTTKELESRVKARTADLAEINKDLEQRNMLIRQVFGRYLSDEIVANLLKSSHSLSLGGERRKVTILNSDLRGFTAVSERLSSEEVIAILNIYLEIMADIIAQYKGTINEFMGDGILVLFGAPTEREDDTPRAIACAVAMQLAMPSINQKLRKLGFPQLEMGIGINTGPVVLGNIGSEKRAKYGIVGSQVNLTYRIESYTVGGQILLAESTFNECRTIVSVRGQKQVQSKGFKEPITIYDLEGIGGSYNLFLPKLEETFITLTDLLPIQYQILDGKHLDSTVFRGSFIKLSKKGAKVRIESPTQEAIPPILANLKLNLWNSANPAESSDDIYAKVSEKSSEQGTFYLHFTAKIPALQIILDELFPA